MGFIATENTGLAMPADLTSVILNQYAAGAHFGYATAYKTLGGSGAVAADTGSMTSGGWATVVFALKALGSGATPTATVATPTSTSTATLAPTVVVPTVTATSTATVTQTATAIPTPGAISLIGSTSSTTTKLTVPAGVQNGDLLLAFYSYWSLATATAPSGWTLLHSATASGSGVETVWYRVAASDAPGAGYTWTFGGSTSYAAGGMVAYRGVASAPFEDGFCTTQGNSATPSLCSFANSVAGDLYLGFFATENTGLVLPGDLTALVVNQYARGSHFGVASAAKSLGAPGVIAADNASMASGGWASVAFALKPAN